MKYSPGFRSSVVRKTLDGSGRSMAQVARETGVSYATITNWIEKYRLGKLDVDDATGVTPDQRNPGEKLTLLLESKTLDKPAKRGMAETAWVTLRTPTFVGTGVDHRHER